MQEKHAKAKIPQGATSLECWMCAYDLWHQLLGGVWACWGGLKASCPLLSAHYVLSACFFFYLVKKKVSACCVLAAPSLRLLSCFEGLLKNHYQVSAPILPMLVVAKLFLIPVRAIRRDNHFLISYIMLHLVNSMAVAT